MNPIVGTIILLSLICVGCYFVLLIVGEKEYRQANQQKKLEVETNHRAPLKEEMDEMTKTSYLKTKQEYDKIFQDACVPPEILDHYPVKRLALDVINNQWFQYEVYFWVRDEKLYLLDTWQSLERRFHSKSYRRKAKEEKCFWVPAIYKEIPVADILYFRKEGPVYPKLQWGDGHATFLGCKNADGYSTKVELPMRSAVGEKYRMTVYEFFFLFSLDSYEYISKVFPNKELCEINTKVYYEIYKNKVLDQASNEII